MTSLWQSPDVTDGAGPRVFNREALPLLDGPTEPNTCSVTQAKEGEGLEINGDEEESVQLQRWNPQFGDKERRRI